MQQVGLIIPALNEEEAIGPALDALGMASCAVAGLPAVVPMQFVGTEAGVTQVVVVDNGSSDSTAEIARARGAWVVREARRGYGQACLAGVAALDPAVSIVAFLDADGSHDLAELAKLAGPIARGEAELVIGSRTLGDSEPGALTWPQQFGNRLATVLLRLFYGVRATDLGPFRAIRREALERLGMRDTGFGWTIEMQIKAHRHGLRVLEVPVVSRKRRYGKSKISGTVRGTLLAGSKILWTILKLRFSA